ncbi:triacylglycerol lipase OBL1-like [Gastrolobium bilobum]|uniref:triacylglycerol lipase OBL1-like n=1 Tax=Gastrolobium bilobum TaxID=150636 RepID=UPI002AB2D763|nr:triacylglycerol lipase OBL1-like [Gastrolobium bilobum]
MGGKSEMFSATSFMFLKPEKMCFFHLAQILFSSNLHKRNFVHCHNVVIEESFDHKWLIFVSLMAQKFLQLVAVPLKTFGRIVELLLNLASNNCNVFMLVFNFLRGYRSLFLLFDKLTDQFQYVFERCEELVDKTSANYVSIVGHLDKRVELDSNIKCEDPKYNAALSMMASKASYENEAFLRVTVKDHWKMELVACDYYWNDYQGKATTKAFILLDKSNDHDTYVVAFRGTIPFDANTWSSDIDISWLELPHNVGKVHAGFMKALGLKKGDVGWPKEIKTDESHPPEAYYAIRDLLKKHLDGNDKAKFIITGHSLGGALAILFPAMLIMHDETFLLERLEGVYTFGQPRVGDKTFSNYMREKLKDNRIEYYRFAYSNDIVPRLPYDDKNMMFKHFGRCLYYDWSYKGKMVHEEPNKNYFSLSAMIPMMVNAFWELIRSFTIVFKYGYEYKEGWLLRFFRLVGLTIPGLPAHLPQDYVNVTRLGSIHSHLD